MRVVMFCHSLVSDWNHGNAHFLRGVCAELIARGHDVDVFEPRDSWSRQNLEAELGTELGSRTDGGFAAAYPMLHSRQYVESELDLGAVLDHADLVLVHEWNSHALVKRIGLHRRDNPRFRLLFHDTHHRSVTAPQSMADYDLSHYDGVLAFGQVIRDLYLERGWTARAWTWHEAADVQRFRPLSSTGPKDDLVWIGNWGDDEREAELDEFLLGPVQDLALKARIHGVRYPARALQRLRESGIDYGGWLPNHEVARTFARYQVTVHVPRRPYAAALPGIPTIRVFEALACGIPLVCAPWSDAEGLFTPGRDYLVAPDRAGMAKRLRAVREDTALASELAAHGLATIQARHTCAHRVDELLDIHAGLQASHATHADSSNRSTDTTHATHGAHRSFA